MFATMPVPTMHDCRDVTCNAGNHAPKRSMRRSMSGLIAGGIAGLQTKGDIGHNEC